MHYERVAGIERAAAERTERINAELQAALDRLRASAAAPQSKPALVTSSLFAAERIAQQDGAVAGSLQQAWARIGTDEAEKKLERLTAEHAALAGERDQLRERVKELEDALALLQGPRARQSAKAPPETSSGTAAGRSAIVFPAGAATGPAGEPSRSVLKNFTAPSSAPDYFSNESGAILGTGSRATDR